MAKTRSVALLIILTLALPFVFPGCSVHTRGGDATPGGDGAPAAEVADLPAKDIADAAMAAFEGEELPPMTRYHHGAPEGSSGYFEPERSGWLISGEMQADPVMDLLSDFAFYVPNGWYAFEVDVLKVKDSGSLPQATAYLEALRERQDSADLHFYNPADVPLIENARIFTVGNYAIMLATPDNDKAQEAIAALLGGKVEIKAELLSAPTEAAEETEFTFPVESVPVVDVEPVIKVDLSILEPAHKEEHPEGEKTEAPTVTVCKYSRNTMFLLGGSCEEGAVISVKGGAEEINSKSDYGDWLVEVPIDPKGVSALTLTAAVPGKAPSDEIKYIVRPQKGITLFEDSGVFGVIVGNDYFSWFQDCVPSFTGSDLLKAGDAEKLKERYAKKVAGLRSKGLDTEIIVLLIPSPMRLYAEHVPSYLKRKQHTGATLADQFIDAMNGAGVTVIDLREVMLEHKYDEFKIFHRTDSHWSDYGAYFGYVKLMEYIARKFPDAAPRPPSDFEFYNKKVYFGDIYATLGLERNVLKEYTTFVKFKFEPPGGFRYIYDGNSVVINHNITNKFQTTESNLTGLNLPSAYIIRDSFCGPIFNFLTDRFSKITWQAMWDYSFNLDRISKLAPDYVIYIINERNIKNIMHQ